VSQDLKPCPFCGHVGLEFGDGSSYRWGIAYCGQCGATCGEVRRRYPDDGKWHAEAIKEWNTRAPAAEPTVPAGMALVPIEPTQQMCQEGQWKAQEWPRFPLRIAPIWKAMVAAAKS